MQSSQYVYCFKFIIVGDSGVGKSCLMNQFIKKQFNSTHEITIGVEFASRVIEIEHDTNVKLQIWDTAGQEAFRSVTRSYYRGAICVILVYDITRRKSFTNIKKWLEDVKDYGYNKVLNVLIGNKSDLDGKRQVSIDEAANFANANNMTFFETSAVTNEGVEKCFLNAARTIYKGVVTQLYDVDQDGEIPGVKTGNVELSASQRHMIISKNEASNNMRRSESLRNALSASQRSQIKVPQSPKIVPKNQKPKDKGCGC